jgi:transposase
MSELEAALAQNELLRNEVASLRDTMKDLQGQIEWLRRQVFGQKRERFIATDEQYTLDLDPQQPVPTPVATQHVEYDRSTSRKAAPHFRGKLPEHLRRERIEITPDFDTSGMEIIRENITEELRMKPAEFYVAQLVCPVFKSTVDGESTLRTTNLPPRCIDKGIAGASVVAQTIMTKCVDHNPLYRFGGQIKRNCNLDIPQSTIDGWFARGVFWLEPIAKRLRDIVLTHDYIQMDETTIDVMIQPTKGKSHLGYMWLMHAPELQVVTFDYCTTRNKKILAGLIGPDYKGIIQTDGLDLYDILDFRENIVHAGCAQHARSYFYDARDNDSARAHVALGFWQKLFAVEADAKKDNSTASQRLELRREKSAPIMQEFKTWLDTTLKETTPKSPIGKAIAYSSNHWKKLTRFLENGRIEISDNNIENRVRPFALGRKNWLFAGSEDGAKRLAVAYTVLGTCLLKDINVFDYLSDVLEKIPSRKSNNIEDLLPTNWKPTSK